MRNDRQVFQAGAFKVTSASAPRLVRSPLRQGGFHHGKALGWIVAGTFIVLSVIKYL